MTVKTFAFVVVAVLVIAEVLFHAVQIRRYIDGFAVQERNDRAGNDGAAASSPQTPKSIVRAQKSQGTQGDEPFHPNAVAKSVGQVPGAIVCPDFPSVQVVFDLYSQYWGDAMQDRMYGADRARVLRGPSTPVPDPTLYGCSLLAPGTPIEIQRGVFGLPMVIAKSPDGTMIRGVTLPDMVSKPLPKDTSSRKDWSHCEAQDGC
jgi:hypothetical protein